MTKAFASAPTRREFLKSTAAFGLSALATPAFAQSADFGPAPAGLPAADGPMRWLDSGGQKGEFLKQYLPEYAKARGIEVIYDGLPWNEIATVLPLGVRNGSAPDTFNLPLGMEPSVALAEGWIQPIEDYIPNFEDWKKAYPDGAFVEGINVFGGKTYGFPFSIERRFNNALLFNRAMMHEAGYDQIGPDQALTFDEMRDAAAKITKNSRRRAFGFIIGGNQVLRWGSVATVLAQRAGATVGSNGLLEGMNLKTGEYVYGSDAYVAGVELLLAMNSDGSVFPGSLGINAPQARAFIAQGAAGMIIQGPWNVPIWEAEAPGFDFGVSPAPAPAGMNDAPVWVQQLPNSANMMWLNARAKNPAYVGDFFSWLGSLDGQIAYAKVASSADPAIFPEALARADLSEQAIAMINMAQKFVRIAPNPFVRNPELAKVAAAYVDPTPNLSQAVQGLFAGQLMGVKETLQSVADARNKALDDAIAKAKAAGANVSRADFVFSSWNPEVDFGPADYATF
jgi:multiple sugar transport system substrate-binding protein